MSTNTTTSSGGLLKRYNQKRDFSITAEPKGRVHKKKTRGLKFVIQEHHASHLHFDFRLEWEGVLKSWSVPKGPVMDTSTKRLAVEVEDHPIEYGKFEGVIPKGEYGGGRVYLWDTGTWEPIGDADEGFRKGRLDFALKGSRLSGRWTMVRTRPGERQPLWLLFYRGGGKYKAFEMIEDAKSGEATGARGAAMRAAESKARSSKKMVKAAPTRATRASAAKAGPARASKKKSAESAPKETVTPAPLPIGRDPNLPQFIAPELPLLVDEAPTGDDWIHELKFDGYRVQARLKRDGRRNRVELITRTGQNWADKYHEIVEELATRPKIRNAILDGEVVALDKRGHSDFQSLQLAMQDPDSRKLQYYAFDLLFLDGEDLRDLPLVERKKRLKKLIKGMRSKLIRYSDDIRLEGKKFLDASCKEGLEGIVSKKLNSPYVSGRTKDWVKTKCGRRQEFVIGGFTEPQGARHHLGALLLGVYEDGMLRYVGKCGTGFNRETLAIVSEKLEALEQEESPFDIKSPRGKGIHFVKPKLVAEIAFSMWTRDQILRVPVFQGLREDKPANQIGKEVPKSMDVRISHPEKVLFKKDKITKGEVAAYYADPKVKKAMLPLIDRRPLALMRCPDGKAGGCFFQKHMSKLPAGLKGTEAYVMVDNELGIQSLVQMGAYELHAWQCREPDVEHPDQIVMDFDPSPECGFETVKTAVLELKEILDQLGFKSFLKTTGGKGLHVHIPIARRYSWDRVKAFSRVLAREMMARQPDKYTDTMSKEKRTGRIFIDYLRNGRGATAVVPYGLRAKDRSAVAMPLGWDELRKLKSSDQFDLKTALKHIQKRKKDPWKGINELQQRIEILEDQPDEVQIKRVSKKSTSAKKAALRGRRPRSHRPEGGSARV